MSKGMSRYKREWEAMIIAIDNFTNKIEEDRIDYESENESKHISEEEMEELEYALQALQGSANDINDEFGFKSYE